MVENTVQTEATIGKSARGKKSESEVGSARMSCRRQRASAGTAFRLASISQRNQHWIDGHPTAYLIDFDEMGRSLGGVLGVQVHVVLR